MKNLIIGGSSKIGRNLNLTSNKFDLTYYKNKIPNGILVDIKDKLSNQLNLDKYSTVIILSSITDPRICQENKIYSESINVKYTKSWGFKNWDTFYVTKPFGSILINYGRPIYFDKSQNLQTCKSILIKAMEDR